MWPKYCLLNDEIIVSKNTKRRFCTFWIKKIKGRWSELKPIDRIVVKKYICIYCNNLLSLQAYTDAWSGGLLDCLDA